LPFPYPDRPLGGGQMSIKPLPADEPLSGPLLLVEGSRGRRAALQHVLARRGFRVTCAADTTSAANVMADIDFGYAVIGLPLRGVDALLDRAPVLPPVPETPLGLSRIYSERVVRIYEQCDRNVTCTAKRLGMHRRTLQRLLGKRAPLPRAVP